jgi:hypothetical protein
MASTTQAQASLSVAATAVTRHPTKSERFWQVARPGFACSQRSPILRGCAVWAPCHYHMTQAGCRLGEFDAAPWRGHASMRRHGSILVQTPSEEVRSWPFRL